MNFTLRICLAILALGSSFLAGCNSSATSLEGSWTGADLKALNIRKVLVVAATPDGAIRRTAEDAIKAQIINAEAVPSYMLMSDPQQLKDREKLLTTLRANGFEGVVVIRLVSDVSKVFSTPQADYPEAYRMFRGYYGERIALSPFYYDSTHVSTSRFIQVETNIYDVATERLVWSGVTSTQNPSSVQQLIQEAASVIRKAMANPAK